MAASSPGFNSTPAVRAMPPSLSSLPLPGTTLVFSERFTMTRMGTSILCRTQRRVLACVIGIVQFTAPARVHRDQLGQAVVEDYRDTDDFYLHDLAAFCTVPPPLGLAGGRVRPQGIAQDLGNVLRRADIENGHAQKFRSRVTILPQGRVVHSQESEAGLVEDPHGMGTGRKLSPQNGQQVVIELGRRRLKNGHWPTPAARASSQGHGCSAKRCTATSAPTALSSSTQTTWNWPFLSW